MLTCTVRTSVSGVSNTHNPMTSQPSRAPNCNSLIDSKPAMFQTTLSNAFFVKKFLKFLVIFLWSMFMKVQSTINGFFKWWHWGITKSFGTLNDVNSYAYHILRIRIRIRNLHCPYFTEKHQGTRKYINKEIWIPTHYKQTKTLSENTKQWYKIIEYNVEQKWQWNDLYTLWHIPHAIAAIIRPEDTEPDEAPLQWNDITALIMNWSATATAPSCIMCHPGRD